MIYTEWGRNLPRCKTRDNFFFCITREKILHLKDVLLRIRRERCNLYTINLHFAVQFSIIILHVLRIITRSAHRMKNCNWVKYNFEGRNNNLSPFAKISFVPKIKSKKYDFPYNVQHFSKIHPLGRLQYSLEGYIL